MSVDAARWSVERYLLQPRILSDDLRRAAALRKLLLQKKVLGGEAPLHERALDEQQEVIRVDRLGKKVERPFLHRRDRILHVAERGHHDDRQLWIELFGEPEHAEPVAFRQAQIGQHHGGSNGLKGRGGLGLIAGLDHGVPLRFERMPQHRPQRVLVLDEQDRRISCFAGARAHRSQPGGTPARRASS